MIDTHYDDPRLSIVAERARCATDAKDLRAILHVCYGESWRETNRQTWHLWSRLASQIERRLSDELSGTPLPQEGDDQVCGCNDPQRPMEETYV